MADGAFDMVTELFAPFNEREFARVLAPEAHSIPWCRAPSSLWA